MVVIAKHVRQLRWREGFGSQKLMALSCWNSEDLDGTKIQIDVVAGQCHCPRPERGLSWSGQKHLLYGETTRPRVGSEDVSWLIERIGASRDRAGVICGNLSPRSGEIPRVLSGLRVVVPQWRKLAITILTMLTGSHAVNSDGGEVMRGVVMCHDRGQTSSGEGSGNPRSKLLKQALGSPDEAHT